MIFAALFRAVLDLLRPTIAMAWFAFILVILPLTSQGTNDAKPPDAFRVSRRKLRLEPGKSTDVLVPINDDTENNFLTQIIKVSEGNVELKVTTRYGKPGLEGVINQADAPWSRLGIGEHVAVRFLPGKESLPGAGAAWSCATLTNRHAHGYIWNGPDAVFDYHAAVNDATSSIDTRIAALKHLLTDDGLAEELAQAFVELEALPQSDRGRFVYFFSNDEKFQTKLAELCDADELSNKYAAVGAKSGMIGGGVAGLFSGLAAAGGAAVLGVGGVGLSGFVLPIIAGVGVGRKVGQMAGALAGSEDEAQAEGYSQGKKAGGVAAATAGAAGLFYMFGGVEALTSQILMKQTLKWFIDIVKIHLSKLRAIWEQIKTLAQTWAKLDPAQRQKMKDDFQNALEGVIGNGNGKVFFTLAFFLIDAVSVFA